MINTMIDLKNEYSSYSDAKGKIRREVKKGKLIQVIRGLYETNKDTPGYYLSSYIYGPSYLSFDYALSYYGLIPERVTTYTSASFNKRKTKLYKTVFGNYLYKDVPKMVFPLGIKIIEENGYVYHIATREKALCDKLYDVNPVKNTKQLKELLFDDLRIDMNAFNQMDKNVLRSIATKYKSKNLTFLVKIIKEDK